jgi:UDP-galactopyranose mutase
LSKVNRMERYDYLIVGAGLYGATCANLLNAAGKRVLVVEKRPHVAGNCFTETRAGICVHRYGAHIFHTDNKNVWQYVQNFSEFNRYTNCVIANYRNRLYSLPFSMYTFNQMWGVTTPQEAMDIIEFQRREAGVSEPSNLEEQALSLVGRDIYETLICGYTEKQWGRKCTELPAFIIRRLPLRWTFDNNYFSSRYQGIPVGGYTKMVEQMLKGIEVWLNTDYLENRENLNSLADRIIYTGGIDAYFGYCLGHLAYRTVRFETEELDTPNYQGNAVVNYTSSEIPWTRIIEHKWFTFGRDENGSDLPTTIISREYSMEWKPGDEPYYPVNDSKNNALYQAYLNLAKAEPKTIFGGRLGEYVYHNMDEVIQSAMALSKQEIAK